MQPSATLPAAEFHDWYNNEHGPLSLRLPFIDNGFRYRATDLEASAAGAKAQPEWMAIYDTPSMDDFDSDAYLALRGAPVQSQRERDIRPHVTIDRRAYDFVSERKSADFKKLEDIQNVGVGNVLVSALLSVKEGKSGSDIDKWYNEEHTDMLSRVPGWLRTRRFVTAAIDKKDTVDYLALHEFAPQNGVKGKEWEAAISTPWTKKILEEVVSEKTTRLYELYYTFGPAPRDLKNFVEAGSRKWESPAVKTKTVAAESGGAVESYVTTKDGAELPYRLEGSTDPDAPLIVLSNSILVEWGIWDGFVSAFLAKNKQYRILRYHTRGRYSNTGETPVTVDLLGSDIVALLDALKVAKAACVIGVSLGGATVLNVALKHPDRVASFISCDTNDKSPAGNSKAWGERIEMAEKEGASAQSGEKIVGEELAEITVRRWFVKESYDGGAMEKECERVKTMVVNNSLEGFKKGVRALWEYDMQPQMKDATVRGVFLAGSGDGVLPKTMKDMASRYGGEAEFVAIDGAGHLPMVEKPEEVAAVATKLLS